MNRLLHRCEELGLQVDHRKSSLVPSHGMTYLAMRILSVRFIAKPTDKDSEPPQYDRGVSLTPEPPSSSLSTSSGPPFVPYPSDEGRDAKNAITPASSQVQVELSRRLPSHPLRSFVPEGSSMLVLGGPTTAGRR